MKKIGLVGGIGPASTMEYYLGIIEKCHKEQGRDRYPEIVIDSVNMSLHDSALAEKDYERLGDYLVASLNNLKAAGAEIAAITANAEHIVWNEVSHRFPLPVLSIVDATISEIKRKGFKKVLVIGTTFVLQSGLYESLLKKSGITAIIPADEDVLLIGNIIYPNLENGIIIPEDRQKLIGLIEKYVLQEKADSLILGCTELPLVIKSGDVSVPVLNTTELHVEEIYRKAMDESDFA